MSKGSLEKVTNKTGPNPREASSGMIKGTPAKKFSSDKSSGGFKFASQSCNLPDRPIRTRNSGNTFKAKPGAK